MKLKIAFIFVFVFCVSSQVNAQLKHYLSLNTVVYYDYFNQEKDRARLKWPRFGFIVPAYPNFSYKIENNQLGVELFYNDNGIGYYRGATYTPENLNKEGAIDQIISANFGLTCHYKVLDKKYISINPMAGLVKIWYDETQMALQRHSGGWIEGYPTHNIEKRLGLLAGVNINVPIWKGIYANTNSRYMVFPGAQYNKQNLVFDIGLGYMYQRKVKTKKPQPNPTNGDVHVEADFLGPTSGDPIYISILDMNGDYVFQQTYQYPLPQSIDVSVLSVGTYSLMVHQGQALGQTNLVKQ